MALVRDPSEYKMWSAAFAASSLSSSINRGARPQEIARLLSDEHPTIQQQITLFCYEWLKVMAAETSVDERNKFAWRFARDVMIQFPDLHFPFI